MFTPLDVKNPTLDSFLGAVTYGAEVTCLNAIGHGTEVRGRGLRGWRNLVGLPHGQNLEGHPSYRKIQTHPFSHVYPMAFFPGLSHGKITK